MMKKWKFIFMETGHMRFEQRLAVLLLPAVMWMATSASADPTNLVYNGDFSLGNTGFSSDYIHNAGNIWNEGMYAITSNPILVHGAAASHFDHTLGTASGRMMAVNGETTPNLVVWGQTGIAVEQNTDYVFSLWVSSWYAASPALLELRVNGDLIGAFGAPAVTGVWQQVSATWNSGTSTTASLLSIVDENVQYGGNDFALDGISFAVIPAPGAALLGVLGLGLVGWIKKRRLA